MNNVLKALLVVAIIGLIAGAYFLGRDSADETVPQENTNTAEQQPEEEEEENDTPPELPAEFMSERGVEIVLTNLYEGQAVDSPLELRGEVPGNWSFEASFPVRLLDGDGRVLAEAPAQIVGDWMTEEPVPFEVDLQFEMPDTETGTLVLEKANASGLSRHDDSLEVEVSFSQP